MAVEKKVVLGLMLIILLANMVTLAFNIQPIGASGTICIRPDGSIEPPTAPISTIDNIVYNLTGNIFDFPIEVERDSIVIDGGGYVLQGAGVQSPDYRGVRLTGRSNVTVRNMEISGWGFGIGLFESKKNIICENNITGNMRCGIALFYDSSNNIVYRNNIANDCCGLKIFVSFNNSIYGNNMTDNIGPPAGVGLSIEDSADNTVMENEFAGNYFGIIIEESTNNTFRNNAMARNKANLRVMGKNLSHFVNDVDSSNTVEGKPVYYLVNEKNKQIPANAGYVGAVNCEGILIKGQNLSNGGELMLAYTTDSTIENVTLCNNFIGMYLFFSSNNVIFHNNFINNTGHVWSYYSWNTWDYGYPLGGNYWSYHTGLDLYSGPFQNEMGSDGIGDTPFVIDADNQDHYPLTQPFHGTVRNLDTGQSSATIQEAINSANVEDRILALSGTYYENIIVNKSVSLIGESKHMTVIDGNGTAEAIKVQGAPNVTIRDFTVRHAQDGIEISSASDCMIVGNIVEDHSVGIVVTGENNTVRNNIIRDCDTVGVELNGASYTRVEFNTIAAIRDSHALLILSSSHCLVNDNNISGKGIWLQWVNNSEIRRNIVRDCDAAISLWVSDYNIVEGNVVEENGEGIKIYAQYNVILRNNFVDNTCGIGIGDTDNTIYHNNFISNLVQLDFMEGTPFESIWDNGCEGNYWSDYNGTDSDGDGLGDTYLPWLGVDHYPLMNRYWNPADINNDLKVDIKDIAIAAKAFGSYPAHSLWNPHADRTGRMPLEPDGVVDIRDIALIALRFGQTYS